MTNEDRTYQRVHITLSNGQRVTYAGRVQIDPSALEGVTVTLFEVSKPKELPKGMRFSEVAEATTRPVVTAEEEPGTKADGGKK